MRTAANTKSRSRSRKKAPASVAPAPAPANITGRNIGPLESIFSLGLGVLFLVGALFPRSFKQLFLLSVGGGLLYRGMTSNCKVYEALGIDTEKGPLLDQLKEKYLAGE